MKALAQGSGWAIVGLLPIQALLPYLLRGRLLAVNGWTIPYLERLRPHYWIGTTIAGLSVIHAMLAMSSLLPATAAYTASLWVATGAMLLAGAQVYIGMKMRTLRGPERLRLRKTHFRVMLALIVAGLLHVALNGFVPGTVVGA